MLALRKLLNKPKVSVGACSSVVKLALLYKLYKSECSTIFLKLASPSSKHCYGRTPYLNVYPFSILQLEDGSLYSLFYFCDIAVNCQMEELNHLMRSNPDNLDRRYNTLLLCLVLCMCVSMGAREMVCAKYYRGAD